MAIKIIVDSACDLSEEIVDKYNIEILPFNIHIADKSYKDGHDIKIKELYSALEDGKIAKTSQVSPKIFKKTFVKNSKEGNDSIYISFSKKMSGAYKTGKLIAKDVEKEYPNCSIEVVDSKSGSVATGLIAYKAALLLKKGKSQKEVVQKIKYWADHIEHIFMLDDLKTLERGGRISKTKSFIGNMLNIKPLLLVNNGKIELFKKSRGSKRAINKMVKYLKKNSYNLSEQIIGVAHADDLEKAEFLKKKIEELGGNVFCTEMIGSVLGAHLGIGGIGIFFLNDN